jgi:hypothetical protein
MNSSAPDQKTAAIEAMLKQFPNWSEKSKQRLRNIGDAEWINSSDATVTFGYPDGQVSIQLQIASPAIYTFKGQADNSTSPPLSGPGGNGTLCYDDIDELTTEGTGFQLYPNSPYGPPSQYLVILFCDTSNLYGMFTYLGMESFEGDAAVGIGAWS